jgi:23S rRNA (guanine2445-N2)-methyltransferase / 23S rRNA (guanine2069-N7)-methyltransferase
VTGYVFFTDGRLKMLAECCFGGSRVQARLGPAGELMDFINTCAAGLETLVSEELSRWGAQQLETRKGAVSWSGALETGYRACLWSRFSSRVILVLQRFEISTSDELYEASHNFGWEDHFGEQQSFAIDCSIGGEAPLSNSMFAALRVKDGIADRFRERSGRRPTVQLERPDIRINLHIFGHQAVLGLDLSGESLHRRGYRVEAGTAPLKESLAAAVIALSGWNGETMLMDPLCGSATLLIEGALIYSDSAPGLGRSYYGLLGWAGHRDKAWSALIEEAVEREEAARAKPWPELIGYDGDQAAIRSARKNIARAGLDDRIMVSRRELHGLLNPVEAGWLVSNPPYGERLSEKQSVRYLYQFFGQRLQQSFTGWQIALLTALPDYGDLFNLEIRESYRLFNGPLPCRLLCGTPLPSVDKNQANDRYQRLKLKREVQETAAEDFSNRLRKNYRHLSPWAAKHQIDCFRIYDRDLPEYNVSVDLLGHRLLIREFAPPAGKDARLVDSRFQAVVGSVRTLFGAGRDQVFISRSRNQPRPGKPQNAGQARPLKLYEVVEAGGVFLVDQGGDLDAAICLDQRFVRQRIAALIAAAPAQASLLSLFDTGGAAAVQATLSGAHRTTTGGLPQHQWERVRMNFARNGMALEHHRLIEGALLPWLKQSRDSYDVIYINPRRARYFYPRSEPFYVVAEQRLLIEYAMQRLRPDGRLFFSTLLPSFQLDQEVQQRFACSNISSAMLPADCRRHRQRFTCWQLSHAPLARRKK